jgi:hypothetical protein
VSLRHLRLTSQPPKTDLLSEPLDVLRHTLAIGVEEGLEGQDTCINFRPPHGRPIDGDGEMDMWDTQEIRTQLEDGCSRGDMTAKLTSVAVSGSYFAFLDPA